MDRQPEPECTLKATYGLFCNSGYVTEKKRIIEAKGESPISINNGTGAPPPQQHQNAEKKRRQEKERGTKARLYPDDACQDNQMHLPCACFHAHDVSRLL